jgi:hypothetical protein
MYKSFEVRNFRCFRELKLADLKRVNLVTGLNNVGKTALLEALFMYCGAYNPSLVIKINVLRGFEILKVELGGWVEAPWNSLFHQFEVSKTIEMEGENTESGRRWLRLRVLREPFDLEKLAEYIKYGRDDSQKALFAPSESQKVLYSSEGAKVLELQFKDETQQRNYYMILDLQGIRTEPIPPGPPFPTFYLATRGRSPFSKEEAERFGTLEIRGEHDVVLRVLQLIEPKLKRLAVVVMAGEPVLHGDVGSSRLIPLPVMGEGMVRLANLTIHIGNAPNGVVLVDEIENGVHHSILPKVWQAVAGAAQQFNTQVFATTHSLECIVAAHKAFSEGKEYDFRLHRLERVGDETRAITYDQEALAAAIDSGFEVR